MSNLDQEFLIKIYESPLHMATEKDFDKPWYHTAYACVAGMRMALQGFPSLGIDDLMPEFTTPVMPHE